MLHDLTCYATARPGDDHGYLPPNGATIQGDGAFFSLGAIHGLRPLYGVHVAPLLGKGSGWGIYARFLDTPDSVVRLVALPATADFGFRPGGGWKRPGWQTKREATQALRTVRAFIEAFIVAGGGRHE